MGIIDSIFGLGVLSAAIGFGVLAFMQAEFRFVRICLGLSALLIAGSLLAWILASEQSVAGKLVTAAIVGAFETGGVIAGLMWLKKKQLVPEMRAGSEGRNSGAENTTAMRGARDFPSSTGEPIPLVLLSSGDDRLQLHNQGSYDLFLWGSKCADERVPIYRQASVIPPGGSFYFPIEKLNVHHGSATGGNGESLVPFEVYLSGTNNKHYTAKFGLLVSIHDGAVAIRTQQNSVVRGGW